MAKGIGVFPSTGGIDPRTTSRDIRLIGRALREGWDIPDSLRQSLGPALADIIKERVGKKGTTKTILSAAKVVAIIARLNLEQQKIDLARELRNEPPEEENSQATTPKQIEGMVSREPAEIIGSLNAVVEDIGTEESRPNEPAAQGPGDAPRPSLVQPIIDDAVA